MAYPYTQSVEVTCAQCGKQVKLDIWQIVDADDQPNLLEQILVCTIHEVSCPNCHNLLTDLDEPLLLLRRTAPLALLFSPAQNTSRQEDSEQLEHFVQLLRNDLGLGWRAEWDTLKIKHIAREKLSSVLASGRLDRMYEMEQQLEPMMAMMQQAMPPELFEMIQNAAQEMTRDPAMRANIEPLLQPGGGVDSAQMGTSAIRLVQRLQELNPTLYRTLENTPILRPAELMIQSLETFVETADWLECRHLLHTHPELLTKSVEEALQNLVTDAETTGQFALAVFQAKLALVRRCRQLGSVDAAIAETVLISLQVLQMLELLGHYSPQFHIMLQNTIGNAVVGTPQFLSNLLDGWQPIADEFDRLRPRFANSLPPAPEIRAVLRDLQGIQPARQGVRREQTQLIRRALALLDRTEHPYFWASLQVQYADNLVEDPGNAQMEQALAAYDAALTVLSYEKTPFGWAQLQFNRAITYNNQQGVDRAEAIEQAITYCGNALKVLTRAVVPTDWARVMKLVGALYTDRLRGERKDNIEKAIDYCLQSLSVLSPEIRTEEWVSSRISLGNAYSNRVYGEPGRNWEKALSAFEQAITVVPPSSRQWAILLLNCAPVYSHRVLGDPAENAEQAIRYGEQALAAWRTLDAAEAVTEASVTEALVNLGNFYLRRVRGGRADNIEQAIDYFEQAIQTRHWQPATESQRWARLMTNLGAAYAERLVGKQRDNLSDALMYLQQALKVQEQHNLLVDAADTAQNIALTYMRLSTTDQQPNMAQASRYFEQAMQLQQQAGVFANPVTLINQAAIHTLLATTTDQAPLQRAREFYQQLLDRNIVTRTDAPLNWARTQLGLAMTYCQNPQAAMADQGIPYLEQALTVFTPDNAPQLCRMTADLLGRLHAQAGRWAQAAPAFRQALAAVEVLYQAALLRSSKNIELAKNRAIYNLAAYTFAQIGQFEEAVVTLEGGRARWLNEALARDQTALIDLQTQDPALYTDYTALVERQAALEVAGRTSRTPVVSNKPQDAAALRATALALRTEWEAVLMQIRQLSGYTDFLQAPTFAKIAQAARPDTPLAYLINVPLGSLTLIVTAEGADTPGTVQPVWANALTGKVLSDLLLKEEGGRLTGGYMMGQTVAGELLPALLAEALPLLGEHLIGPLAKELRKMGASGVTLVPAGPLALFPLHAASYAVGSQRQTFLDEFTVTYSPTAQAVTTARHALAVRSDGPMVVAGLGDPATRHGNPLPFAVLELEQVVAQFAGAVTRPLYRAAATKAAFLAAAHGATHIHCACHGQFRLDDPLSSGLALAGDNVLTLNEIASQTAFRAARLVVLSACQSAITDIAELPDEAIGLPTAFLQAGVPTVIGTLWSVSDFSTALLMQEFYSRHVDGEHVSGALALRGAQKWLRDVSVDQVIMQIQFTLKYGQENNQWGEDTLKKLKEQLDCLEALSKTNPTARPFADPIYWAAFTMNGA